MRILKFFVILGGIGLLAGYALLFQRFFANPSTPAVPVVQAVAVGELELPVGGRVVSLSPHGEGSALLVESPAGQEVVLLDKRGNLLKRLPARPSPPK